MSKFNSIVLPASATPTVEIDPSCHSVYIRFKKARVHKTISSEEQGKIMVVDLGSDNSVIGVELVGVKEFSISAIRHRLPETMQAIDFNKARFMPASKELVEA